MKSEKVIHTATTQDSLASACRNIRHPNMCGVNLNIRHHEVCSMTRDEACQCHSVSVSGCHCHDVIHPNHRRCILRHSRSRHYPLHEAKSAYLNKHARR